MLSPTAATVSLNAADALLANASAQIRAGAAPAHAAFLQARAALPAGADPMRSARLLFWAAMASLHRNDIASLQQEALELLAFAAHLPWPADSKPRPPQFDAALARDYLEHTLNHLARRGLIAFATAGTLLGLVRDGALLPNDKDLDLVVPFRSLDAACAAVRELGWEDSWVVLKSSNYRCFVHQDSQLTLDLLGYDFDPAQGCVLGGWWLEGLPREQGRLLRFAEFQLTRQQNARGAYWALTEPERMLEALYGPGWRVPDPDFDSILGTPALAAHNAFTHAWGALRLADCWLNGQQRAFARLLRVLDQLDPADPALRLARGMREAA